MAPLRVLIAGASIAGPTAAYWFAKVGAKVTVVERFPKLREGGQNIDIRTAGVAVMRKMGGMEAAVRAHSAKMEGASLVDANGRSWGTIRPTGNPDQQSLISEYEILRGDLARVLFDLTKDNDNISYVFGEQVASIEQDSADGDGPLTVAFANGLPTSSYDLVVACDGSNSRTRALGLGCRIRDHVKSRKSWAAYYTIPRDLLAGSQIGQGYNAPGGLFCGMGLDRLGATTQVTMMAMKPFDGPDTSLPFREAAKQGEDALKQFVAQAYRGAGWRTDELVQGMMESTDFYASEFVRVKPPSLSSGRFVMVGDAGYGGSFGGGTSLAIAGAYVLAGEVHKHKGDLPTALRCYEEVMTPIVDDLQRVLPLFPGLLAPQTAWGIWLRNSIFAVIIWSKVLTLFQSLFSGAFVSADKHKLPEYIWETLGSAAPIAPLMHGRNQRTDRILPVEVS